MIKKNTFHTFFNYGSIDSIYRTSLITTSKEGCIDTVFKSITVSPTLLANFELDTDQLCEPYILKINNLSSGACENCYLWKFGDNGTSNDDSTVIFHTYPEKDQQNTYNVSVLLWNNNNKCLDSLKRTVVVNPPLRAIFNLEDTVCSPYTTTFNDISTGSGTRYYTWDFGDGYLSSLIEPLHTFANNGLSEVTYKVSLSTRSEFGCKDDTSHTITLFPAPEANFSITPFMQFFPNATYSFKDLTNPGPWKYLWTFGDGRDTSVSGNIKHTYFHWGEKAKEYKLPITLITSNVNCADTAYDTLILFPPKPVARFDTMSDGCTPIVVNFVNQSQWAESYEWDFNDRDTSSAENPIHTFTADSVSQDYRVTLTVHAEGGSDSYSEILKVYPIPIADFDVEPKYIILPKNTIKCYNHTINGYTYLWDFGDGSYGPENSYSDPKHMYNPEDEEKTYTLSLIALSEYGCSDTLTKDSIVFIKTGGDVKYPTAFVPSSSGPNDGNVNNVQDPNSLFRPFVESVKEYHFEIYNRWGDLIFTTDNIDIGWNGYFRNDGKKCAQDVYIYKAWGKFTNGQTFIKAGDVTLLHQDKK